MATEALRAARAAKGETLEIGEIKGMDAEEILGMFYGQVLFTSTKGQWARPFEAEAFRNQKLIEDLVDADTGEVVAKNDEKLTARVVRKIAEKTKRVLVARNDLLGRFVAVDMYDPETGEIFAEAGEELVEAEAGAAGRARASTSCRRWRSTRATARGSATRWRWTRTATARMR